MRQAGAKETGSVDDPMVLNGIQPLFQGFQRLVFQHPQREDLLIKLVRPEYAERKFGPRGAFRNRNRRCRHYHVFLRELREYLAAAVRSQECLPFLQDIVGLVHTDLGLGLVVVKVRDRNGEPAQSLAQLARQGSLDAARMRLLEDFLTALEASEVVVDDPQPGNIVLGVSASGVERFVLIDGLGSSTFIPLKALVPWANRWSKRRRFARLRRELARKADTA